jgi:hypothetical protein
MLDSWCKGLRNGNWYRLSSMERVFFRAAACYAKTRSRIINNSIIADLRMIAEKLISSIRRKIVSAGKERAGEMLTEFEDNGVFKWVPQLKKWLKDAKYVFWLGLSLQPSHDIWIT